MSFADDPFPSGWEIATNNYLVSSESSSEDVFGSLDLDLGTDKVFFICNGIRWTLFSHFHHNSQSLIIIFVHWTQLLEY